MKEANIMNVAIIGGGASGVLAALRIKQNNPNIDVVIFEKNNKILKKVIDLFPYR